MRLIAATGLSGFIGRHLAQKLQAQGHRLRGLSRARDREVFPGVEWIIGDIRNRDVVRRVVAGADFVIHAAGVVSGVRPDTFTEVNLGGTQILLEALRETAPDVPLILVSSLAAREPDISSYAQSKHLAERAVLTQNDGRQVIVVRPPAVYGPGDRMTLPLFAALARGWLPAPRNRGSFSLIYVEDLARLLSTLLEKPWPPTSILEPDDCQPEWYDWQRVAAIASRVVSAKVRLLNLPRSVFMTGVAAAHIAAGLRRRPPVLTADKVAELFHPDWRSDRSTMTAINWRPSVVFAEGLSPTLNWYRSHGWI